MSVKMLREAGDADVEHAIDQVIESKDQRATWSDETMREALRGLSKGMSYSEVMEDIEEVSQATVNTQVNYAAEYLPEDSSDEGSDTGDEGSGRYEVDDEPPTSSTSGGTFVDPPERAAEEFREWLEEIGEKVGMNEQFIESEVYDVKRHGTLPSTESLGDAIDMGNSGVANGRQIRWVVGHYRDWLDEYQTQVKPYVAEETLPGRGPSADSWSDASGQRSGRGRGRGAEPGSRGDRRDQPQQSSPEAQVLQQVMETQKQMMEEVRELKETRSPSGGVREQEDPLNQMQRIMEMREKFKELEGDNDQNDEAMKRVQKSLMQLQQEMQNKGSQVQADDPVQAAILNVAQNGDLSVDELKELTDAAGAERDPQVIEKKMEKEMKEQELNHKQERTEQVMDGVQNIVTTLGKEFAERVEQGQQAAQQQAMQQQMAQQGTPAGRGRSPTGGRQRPQQTGATGQRSSPPAGGAQTTPRGDGGTPTPDASNENETTTCPRCDTEQTTDPDKPSFECVECDYSLDSCPGARCGNLLEIEPPEVHDQYQCPECDHHAIPGGGDEELTCSNCDWEGSREESPGQVIHCDQCGLVSRLRRGEQEAGA